MMREGTCIAVRTLLALREELAGNVQLREQRRPRGIVRLQVVLAVVRVLVRLTSILGVFTELGMGSKGRGVVAIEAAVSACAASRDEVSAYLGAIWTLGVSWAIWKGGHQ